jgi:enterochelin esterase-like enzyme
MSLQNANLQLVNWIARLCIVCSVAYSSHVQADQHSFELDAPAARKAYLAGEMTDWDNGKLPMFKGTDGKWHVTVDLTPGQWLYKFVVDGRWIADPGSPDHDADGEGGQHSFIFVGKGDWEDLPSVPKGRVDTQMVPSKTWGKAIKLNIYLPPRFDRGERYPVLWLLHGGDGNVDADQWLKTGKVDRYMNNLIAKRAIHPFVIVMPSSPGGESMPYTGKSEQFITEELPTWLTSTYGLRADRNQSGVAGMSWGGFGAFSLPLKHSDLYGFSFSLSGYFRDDFIAALPNETKLPVQSILVCGRDDSVELLTSNRKLVDALNARHSKFYYHEDPGAHTWHFFGNRTVEMLTAADAFFSTKNAQSNAIH